MNVQRHADVAVQHGNGQLRTVQYSWLMYASVRKRAGNGPLRKHFTPSESEPRRGLSINENAMLPAALASDVDGPSTLFAAATR